MLSLDFDPDELLGITQAYAGQVSMLDTCVGALLDFFYGLPISSETLLSLTSARGFPLGEHLRVGPCDGALFGEALHVPWMVQLPDGAGAAMRSPALLEPSDLWATLLDWWAVARPQSPTADSVLPLIRQEAFSLRDRLCMAGRNGQRAIRTPAWHLRANLDPELFAKPDDRWEINNVASRCQDVVENLFDALTEYELALPAGRIAELPPLGDVLLKGLG
jgi:arylsulfatase A-like enzyme